MYLFIYFDVNIIVNTLFSVERELLRSQKVYCDCQNLQCLHGKMTMKCFY